MPISLPRSLSTIHSLVFLLQPTSVIDIGVGHGKTGVLLREYLDIANERYDRSLWTTRIHGIEAFAGYRNTLWDYAYDEIRIGDALSEIQGLPEVDMITALDVWEHFTPEYGSGCWMSVSRRRTIY